MKNHLRCALLATTIFFTPSSIAQISANTVLGLGKGIAEKVKDSKKKRGIEKSFSTIFLNGKEVIILRVAPDKIISNAKVYIIRAQEQLEIYNRSYQQGERLLFPSYEDDIAMIRNLDAEWPTEHYETELKHYRHYDQQLEQQEIETRDSLNLVKRRKEQEVANLLELLRKKVADSIAYTERIKGFHFIRGEFSLLREKPSTDSKVIGRIYRGSYVKIIGYSDRSSFIKISFQDIAGYIDPSELIDDLDKLSVNNTEIAIYKARQYYKYIPNYDYSPGPEESYAAPVKPFSGETRQKVTTSKKKSYSASRDYIRGPRGGCYYISSNNTKVYVDRGLCN